MVQTSHSGSRVELDLIVDPDNLPTAFDYTSAGRLKLVTDPRNATTSVVYDRGKVDHVAILTPQDPTINDLNLDYDPSSARGFSRPTDADSVRSKFDGPRTDVTDSTRFFVNGWGAVTAVQNPLHQVTRVERNEPDFPGLPTDVIYPNGRRVETIYTAEGLPDEVTDHSIGATTSYDWNTVWREVERIESPEGVVRHFSYDELGRRETESFGSQSSVTYSYLSSGLVDQVDSPEGRTTSFTYDDFGNVETVTSPLGFVTEYLKNAIGLDTLITRPIDGTHTASDSIRYDGMGRETHRFSRSGKDDLELQVLTAYDPATKDRTSVTRWSTHDESGIGQIVTTWQYDHLGRVRVETDDAGRDDIYQYDDAGNLTTHVTRRGQTVSMSYDPLNRVESRSWAADTFCRDGSLRFFGSAGYPSQPLQAPAGFETFEYDVMGNLRRATNGDSRVGRVYDAAGRLIRDTLVIASYDRSNLNAHKYLTVYEYDLDGRRRVMNRPQGLGSSVPAVEYQYDEASRLESLEVGSEEFVFSYDDDGLLIGVERPGDLIEVRGYDDDGRLTRRYMHTGANKGWSAPGAQRDTVVSDTLVYQSDGRITWVQDVFATSTMNYTGLGMLEDVSLQLRTNNVTVTDCLSDVSWSAECYAYDALGNPIEVRRGGATGLLRTQLFEYNAQGQLESQTDLGSNGRDNKARFDEAGNRRSYEEQNTQGGLPAVHDEEAEYFYDALDRLRFADRRTCMRDGNLCTAAEAQDAVNYGAAEEYRYDALGRRILTHSVGADGICDPINKNCPNHITRTVWDGDQILFEIRYPTKELLGPAEEPHLQVPEIPVDLERDTGTIDLRGWECIEEVFEDCIAITPPGEHVLSQRWYPYGVVGYVHGLGSNQPLLVERRYLRQGEPELIEIMPITDYRGTVVDGATMNGSRLNYVFYDEYRGQQSVEWPGRREYVGNELRDEQLREQGPTFWMGSLSASMKDASGLVYKRNRYYDPITGLFTQEDPIGIAGGLNLYGYAGGDPINYSDPFGLCPWPPSSRFGRAGADLAAGFTPGLSTGVDVATAVTGSNPITGEDVGLLGRGVALAGALTPFSGGQIRGVSSLTDGAANAIQRFANKYNIDVTLIGSRAGGTARADSDFDYLIGGNSRVRHAAGRELPRGSGGGEYGFNGPTGIDIFNANRTPLDPTKPHIIFRPDGGGR